MIDWSAVSNPVLDRRPEFAVRDPAVVRHDGDIYMFHSVVDVQGERTRNWLGLSTSSNLCEWDSRTLAGSEEMFCAPGNLIRRDGRWVLCLQNYPIPSGEVTGDDSARLYLTESDDLRNWRLPD